MKANELRIGNYVNVPRKEQSPFRVDYFDNVKVYQDNGTYECTPIGEIPMHPLTWDLADIEGIPLTPEILEKCGFEEEITQDIMYHHHSGFFFFELWDKENRRSNGYWLKFLNKFDLEIKYLHQLQNLYFAISGQELEVNL